MLITLIAQHMQVSIRQFLSAGDPYCTFLTKNFGVLNISGFTMGLYRLANRLYYIYYTILYIYKLYIHTPSKQSRRFAWNANKSWVVSMKPWNYELRVAWNALRPLESFLPLSLSNRMILSNQDGRVLGLSPAGTYDKVSRSIQSFFLYILWAWLSCSRTSLWCPAGGSDETPVRVCEWDGLNEQTQVEVVE